MAQLDLEDKVTSESNKEAKKKRKEKKRKRQSEDVEETVETPKTSSKDKKPKKDEKMKNGNASGEHDDDVTNVQAGADDKQARREARKQERTARRVAKEALLEQVPKTDEHGIAYTKLQIKRMVKRAKQGLNPVPTDEEERQRLRNEAKLRREEEEELAGLMFKREDKGDEEKEKDDSEEEDGDESESGKDQIHGENESGDDGSLDDNDGEEESEDVAQPPPKKKAKRSKPVPPDYICKACNNRHLPAHWIYDCPSKKTMKGINNKKKKERGIHEPDSRKIFVSGLPFEIKVSDIQQLFNGCGEISSCKLLKFNDSGRCNGQAYVSFTTDEAASRAIKLSGTSVPNSVDESKKKKKQPKDVASAKRQELKLKISRVLNRWKTKKNIVRPRKD